MSGLTKEKRKVERINLTISGSMHSELYAIAQKFDMKILDAIREAISDWMKEKKSELMKEGYLARAKEDLKIMQEFKHLDNELW